MVAEPKLPWWKRLFGRGKKKQESRYAAGERKSSMKKAAPKTGGIRGLLGKIGIVRGLLGLVVAIGIFGYVGIPSFRGMVTSAVDPLLHGGPMQVIENIRKIVSPKPAQVVPRPEDVTASSEVKGHEARLIRDGSTATDWQGTDKVPEITVKFEEPIDLGWVIVTSGNSAAFADMRRPSALEFDFPDGSTKRIDLEDTKEPQTFELSGGVISSVVIRVVDTNGPESTPISISEIEFFKKTRDRRRPRLRARPAFLRARGRTRAGRGLRRPHRRRVRARRSASATGRPGSGQARARTGRSGRRRQVAGEQRRLREALRGFDGPGSALVAPLRDPAGRPFLRQEVARIEVDSAGECRGRQVALVAGRSPGSDRQVESSQVDVLGSDRKPVGIAVAADEPAADRSSLLVEQASASADSATWRLRAPAVASDSGHSASWITSR